MADFIQAIKWLKDGKKVKKNGMSKNVYLFMKDDAIKHRGFFEEESNADNFSFYDDLIEGNDWEIYEEIKTLSDTIQPYNFIDYSEPNVVTVPELKNSIQQLIKDYRTNTNGDFIKALRDIFGEKLLRDNQKWKN